MNPSPTPVGYFYPDIYRMIARQRPGSFYSLATSSRTLFNIVRPTLQEFSNLPPTIDEITNYMWNLLSASEPISLCYYKIDQSTINCVIVKVRRSESEKLSVVTNETDEIVEIPATKESLLAVVKVNYRPTFWLDVNFVYEIFTRRRSCFAGNPYYNLISTFRYLKDQLTTIVPFFPQKENGIRLRLLEQFDDLSRFYQLTIGNSLPSIDSIVDLEWVLDNHLHLTPIQYAMEVVHQTLVRFTEIFENLEKNRK